MRWPAARTLLAGLLVLWTFAVWMLNRPGHLSVDSLIQIAEGRSGVFESYNPLFISVVFGKLTDLAGGTDALVVIATVALAASAWLLLGRIERPGLGGTAAAGVLLFLPVLLVYPGIVWKDVWFAHAALLGFALVTLRGRLPPLAVDALCLALFAFAMLCRQTGILVAGAGVLTLATAAGTPGRIASSRLRFVVAVLVRLAVMLALAQGLSLAAKSTARQITGAPFATGVRLVALFDIAGMLQRLPKESLDRFARLGVDTSALEPAMRRTFSAERFDKLELPPTRGLAAQPLGVVLGQWFDLAGAHPMTYLAHRGEVYAWLLGLRDQAHCLPVHVGYESAPLASRAGIDAEPSRYATRLFRYSRKFVGSPYFSPLFWGAVSSFVLVYLRRRGQHLAPIGGLQWAGLVYVASYLPIALACDFRYAYFSTLAASLGLMHVLIDWSGRRGRRLRPTV